MLRAWLIAGILLLGIGRGVFHEHQTESQKHQEATQANTPTVSAPTQPETEAKSTNSTPKETKLHKWWDWLAQRSGWFWPPTWSNWVLAIVGAIGICVAVRTVKTIQRQAVIMIKQSRILQRQADTMERQTKATEDAAKAALLNAQAVITSERAWMVTEPCDANIPPEIKGTTTGVRHVGFSVRFKNMGETPAFLLEIRYSGKVLPSKEQLPEVPYEYEEREIFKWRGKGLPLLPQNFILKNHVNTWAKEPVLIDRGFDVLWVYGYIKYRDAFGENRETWFCHRWAPEIEGWQKSGFISDGPESYNHAT